MLFDCQWPSFNNGAFTNYPSTISDIIVRTPPILIIPFSHLPSTVLQYLSAPSGFPYLSTPILFPRIGYRYSIPMFVPASLSAVFQYIMSENLRQWRYFECSLRRPDSASLLIPSNAFSFNGYGMAIHAPSSILGSAIILLTSYPPPKLFLAVSQQ